MVILLTGPDTFRSRRRLHQLRDAFRTKHDPSGLNIVALDGLTATAEEVRSAVQSTGFFSTKRFVVVDGWQAAAACSAKALSDVLVPLVESKDIIIVVLEDVAPAAKRTTKKRGKGTKTVTKDDGLDIPGAKIEPFPRLDASELARWAMRETKELGATLSPALANQLVAVCENDSWRVAQEVAKLALFAGVRPISVEDLDALTAKAEVSDIFSLTDAIGQRQHGRALALLHRELEAGTHPLTLVAVLANHLLTLYRVKTAAPGPDLAQRLGLHPYVAQKASAQAKAFTPDELRALYHDLVEIDLALKSTPLDAESLLDVFMTRPRPGVSSTTR